GYCLTPTAELAKTERSPIATSGRSISVCHQTGRSLRKNQSVCPRSPPPNRLGRVSPELDKSGPGLRRSGLAGIDKPEAPAKAFSKSWNDLRLRFRLVIDSPAGHGFIKIVVWESRQIRH